MTSFFFFLSTEPVQGLSDIAEYNVFDVFLVNFVIFF